MSLETGSTQRSPKKQAQSQEVKTLVVMAAGVGSRYGGLKQLAPIGPHDEALMEFSIYDGLRAGFDRVVIVVRSETESLFQERFAERLGSKVELHYAHQSLDQLPPGFEAPPGRTKPWGTLAAVLAAEPWLDGPFAVINADDFYGRSAYRELIHFLELRRQRERDGEPPGADAAVVGFPVSLTLSPAGPVSRAACRTDHRGRLERIEELHKVWRRNPGMSDSAIVFENASGIENTLDENQLVSMNMWFFLPEVLPQLKTRFVDFLNVHGQALKSECLLPDEIQALVSQEAIKVQVLPGTGPWCGMTFTEDVDRVKSLLTDLKSRGTYPENLWA